jgi:hypothetical protein
MPKTPFGDDSVRNGRFLFFFFFFFYRMAFILADWSIEK